MPTALIQGRIAVQFQDLFRREIGDDWTTLIWDPDKNDPDEFAPMAAEADAIVGGGIPTKSWPPTPNLKIYQIPWTGYDFCSAETMPKGVPVCNCFEHESAIAEYVVLAMLEWKIGLRVMDPRFRREGWGGRPPGFVINHGELMGATVGIIGYGHIGEAVAARAKPFGTRIIATRRREHETPEPLDWLGTPARMDELLAESDFVVVACDLNAETEGMIGADQLAKMKLGGVIINVARGRVIDEQSLYDALKAKSIGGAVIDTWYNHNGFGQPEVWPSNLPFQDLDNVIVTAHESAATVEQTERRWQFVAANLERAAKGEELQNYIFTGLAEIG